MWSEKIERKSGVRKYWLKKIGERGNRVEWENAWESRENILSKFIESGTKTKVKGQKRRKRGEKVERASGVEKVEQVLS